MNCQTEWTGRIACKSPIRSVFDYFVGLYHQRTCPGVYVGKEASMPHFRRTSGWLIILAAAMALAQTSVAPSPTEACTSDDYAIYTAALTDLYGKQKIERVILIDQFNGCCTRYGGDDAVWRQGATAAQRLLERGKGRLRRSQQDPCKDRS
jgi:hypothetical protein